MQDIEIKGSTTDAAVLVDCHYNGSFALMQSLGCRKLEQILKTYPATGDFLITFVTLKSHKSTKAWSFFSLKVIKSNLKVINWFDSLPQLPGSFDVQDAMSETLIYELAHIFDSGVNKLNRNFR